MRAAVLKRVGGIDDIEIVDLPKPQISGDQCLVRVLATALNHRDYWIVLGKYAKIKVPVVLGSDVCGVVEKTADSSLQSKTVIVNPGIAWGSHAGAQASDFRILGMPDQGGLAEYIAVPRDYVTEKPPHLSDEESAALPLAGLTAYRALFVRGGLSAEDVVLITGIGGGVASMALRFTLATGARVVVTSGDRTKIEAAIKEGALAGFNYKDEDWAEKLKQAVSDLGGISLIIDGAGGPGFGDLINVLRPAGRMVSYGATRGNPEKIDLRKIFWKQLTVAGSTMGSPEDFHRMIEFVTSKKIKPVVDKVFGLHDIGSAFQRMADGGQFGKIIVKP